MMKVAIMIPTYNESESIKNILEQIDAISLPDIEIHVLVIDDNSPDKTAQIVESLHYKNVDILKRPNKDGLGNAYKAGIKYLLQDKTFTHLVSMDADGSHRVVDLIEMLKIANENPGSDLILGSRWIQGGKVVNWPFHRKLLSKGGTRYAGWALKLDIKDITALDIIKQVTNSDDMNEYLPDLEEADPLRIKQASEEIVRGSFYNLSTSIQNTDVLKYLF